MGFYDVWGFSKGLGEMLLSDRDKYEPEFRGRKVIEIGAGSGNLLEPLLELGVTEYCATEVISYQIRCLWNEMLRLSGQEGNYDAYEVQEILKKSNKEAIDELVASAQELEGKYDLDRDELLRKYFPREARSIYDNGALKKFCDLDAVVDGVRRRLSLFYTPDIKSFLENQGDDSAIVISAGSFGSAFMTPKESNMDDKQSYRKDVAAQIYRVTPKGSVSIHVEADPVFDSTPFIEEEKMQREMFLVGDFSAGDHKVPVNVFRKPEQPSPEE